MRLAEHGTPNVRGIRTKYLRRVFACLRPLMPQLVHSPIKAVAFKFEKGSSLAEDGRG